MKICKNCGHEVDDADAFCSNCGHAFGTDAYMTQNSNTAGPSSARHVIKHKALFAMVAAIAVALICAVIAHPYIKERLMIREAEKVYGPFLDELYDYINQVRNSDLDDEGREFFNKYDIELSNLFMELRYQVDPRTAYDPDYIAYSIQDINGDGKGELLLYVLNNDGTMADCSSYEKDIYGGKLGFIGHPREGEPPAKYLTSSQLKYIFTYDDESEEVNALSISESKHPDAFNHSFSPFFLMKNGNILAVDIRTGGLAIVTVKDGSGVTECVKWVGFINAKDDKGNRVAHLAEGSSFDISQGTEIDKDEAYDLLDEMLSEIAPMPEVTVLRKHNF